MKEIQRLQYLQDYTIYMYTCILGVTDFSLFSFV